MGYCHICGQLSVQSCLALLQDPARARSLGETGPRQTDSEFSHATMVRRIEDVYRSALDRTSAPDVSAEGPELRTTP